MGRVHSLPVVSGADSNLKALSHDPTDGSFSAQAFQPTENTNHLNQRFLNYHNDNTSSANKESACPYLFRRECSHVAPDAFRQHLREKVEAASLQGCLAPKGSGSTFVSFIRARALSPDP